MSYLEDIRKQIHARDFHKFLILWEEYVSADQVDVEEFASILKDIKSSDFAPRFAGIVESVLTLWETIEDEEGSYQILKLLIDLETTNSPKLADLTTRTLQKRFGDEKHYQDFLRMVGLRTRTDFQGALSNFELLCHLKKGNFVFHSAGWGTGEIMDVSILRETASIEFENVAGTKHITFANAFKTLIPLSSEHFLSKRFAEPDLFEQYARDNPAKAIKLLLRDLGPKTSSEIKDELVDLVIPEADWNKWWQQAKNRLKKDTMVQTPSKIQEPFVLRKEELSHSQELYNALENTKNSSSLMHTIYTYVRDIPALLKDSKAVEALKEKLLSLLDENLTAGQKIQLLIFIDTCFPPLPEEVMLAEAICKLEQPEKVIEQIDILAFRKRALTLIRKYREDWKDIFFASLFTIEPSNLREYLLDQLNKEQTKEELVQILRDLMIHPENHPEFFFWYFQKLVKEKKALPFGDKEGLCLFLEHFLILLHRIEQQPEHKDLAKKMVQLLTAQRYKLIRSLIEESSLDFIKEFLLLISKCHSFSSNDQKNIKSLAQVVHPTLSPKDQEKGQSHVVWTTEAGYNKTRDRIEKISTVEMIENAKEVEKARSYGDLRENAEYKYAVEKRQRLQSELRGLSQMLNHARIITNEDIDSVKVGVGNIVHLETSDGNKITYTILGPWDSDSETNIISLQSKLAQAMLDCKKGDAFTFRDETYKVVGIDSYL